MLWNGEDRGSVYPANIGYLLLFTVILAGLIALYVHAPSPEIREMEKRQAVVAAQNEYQSGGLWETPISIPPANYLEDVQWLLAKMDEKDGKTLTPEELAYAKATFTGKSVTINILDERRGRYHRTVELSHDHLLVRRDAQGEAEITLTTKAVHELRPAVEAKDKVKALKIAYQLRGDKELFIEDDFLRKLALEGSVAFLKSLI